MKPYASPEELAKYDEVITQLREQRKQYAKMIEPLIEKYSKQFIDSVDAMSKQLRENMLVYCMTEELDNHNLWETYANNYSGFCIEYSFEKYFEADFDNYKNLACLLPVVYRKSKPYLDISPYVEHELQKNNRSINIFDNNPDLYIKLCMQIFYKKADYKSEREWRFAIDKNQDNMQYFPFVNAIYAGKNIKSRNLSRLKNIADKLGVPIFMQTVNKANNRYLYLPYNEVEK